MINSAGARKSAGRLTSPLQWADRVAQEGAINDASVMAGGVFRLALGLHAWCVEPARARRCLGEPP